MYFKLLSKFYPNDILLNQPLLLNSLWLFLIIASKLIFRVWWDQRWKVRMAMMEGSSAGMADTTVPEKQ